MAYHKRRRGLRGFGDSSSPPVNVKFPECPKNVEGWCVPGPGGAPVYFGIGSQTISVAQAQKEEGGGSTIGNIASAFLKGLTGGFGTSTMTPAQQPVIIPQSSGPSTTTIVAIGGAALVAVLLLTRD